MVFICVAVAAALVACVEEAVAEAEEAATTALAEAEQHQQVEQVRL